MIGAKDQMPLKVSNEGTAGPYVRFPTSRLDELRRLLDENQVPYEVDEYFITLGDGPEIGVIDFGRGADPDTIQALLDSIQCR